MDNNQTELNKYERAFVRYIVRFYVALGVFIAVALPLLVVIQLVRWVIKLGGWIA